MTTGKKPLNPYLVLIAGFVMPCLGQLLNRMPTRALTFAFFCILFGWVTLNLVTPEVCSSRQYTAWRCFFVQNTGVVFIWLVAAMDAYQTARIRMAEYLYKQTEKPSAPAQTQTDTSNNKDV